MILRWLLVLLLVALLSLALPALQFFSLPAGETALFDLQPWPAPGEDLSLPLSGQEDLRIQPSPAPSPSPTITSSPQAFPTATARISTPAITPEPVIQASPAVTLPAYTVYLEPYAPYEPPVLLPEPVAPPPDPFPADMPIAALTLDSEADLLLPDLHTLPPYHLRIVIDGRRKLLRFSNSIANLGLGPLELRGKMDPNTNQVKVMQYIYLADGTAQSAPVGQFYFHDAHSHWHWEGFSLYEVWSVDEAGQLVDHLYSSDKVGYCLRDDAPVDSLWAEGSARQQGATGDRTYLSCTTQRQGLSIGWTDVYLHNTPGQYVDVSDLEDGIYALRSVTDPESIIYELSRDGNEQMVYFLLQGTRVSLVDPFTPKNTES